MLVVMTGSVLAQAYGLAISPVISRLFTPADFGVFGSFGAVAGVIASIVTLGYAEAIMLPKREEDAGQVLLLCCTLTLVVACACAGACLLFPGSLMGLMETESSWLLVLLVLAVLAAGANVSFQTWCVRVKAFRRTATSQVVRGLSSNSLQVGFGFLSLGAHGLAVSSVFADLLASVNLFHVARSRLATFLHEARFRRVFGLAVEYRDFLFYSAPMDCLDALSRGLPVLLLGHYYGIEVAGAYAFGVRLLQSPMGLVTNAVRQVLYQKASETHNAGGALLPLYLKTTGGLFALAVVPSLIVFVWSPTIFVWLFGARWEVAGSYARWLVVWLLLMFCNVPSILVGRILRIQRQTAGFQVVMVVGRSLVLILGGLYLTAEHTILAFSLVGALVNAAVIVYVGRVLKRREATLHGRLTVS